jgi:hypothetical protein
MALQATLFLDIPDQQLTLNYTLNGSQIDQLTYSNNQITFGSTAGFNLIKTDFIIYNVYLNTFLNSLIANFPIVQNSRGISLPLSSFVIQLTSSGVEHIDYIQTSSGNSVYNTNYVPLASSASLAVRSTITITMQEFLVFCELHNIYANVVGLN